MATKDDDAQPNRSGPRTFLEEALIAGIRNLVS
jgi:hypothetical protein